LDDTYRALEGHTHGDLPLTVQCLDDTYRALEGHTHGDLPWAWCDEGLDDQMGTLVGEYTT